jgi:hypothetical protein
MRNKASQQHRTARRYGRFVRNIALIVASGCALAGAQAEAAEPPPDLLKRIAAKATENATARENYTYRQSVTVQELDHRDLIAGQYREVRDVTFSPNGARYEQVVEAPKNTLTQIKLTPQDFSDIRTIQPFFITNENLWLYRGKYKGEETKDGVLCFVEYLEPKQILADQRFFQGLLWVRESDFAVIQSYGQAVPQIDTLKQQNLFPHFTTIWKQVDGKWMFPVETSADDTLFFRDWPQRIRIEIKYENYRRFGAESTLMFGGEPSPPATSQAAPPKPK